MGASGALVVIGGFGIDTNVYVVGERLGAETTFAHTTDGLGQAGCYSALAAAALGVPTRAIAALGDDRMGAWVRAGLEGAGVEVTELRDPRGTHRSVNFVSSDGSRRNYFDPRGAGGTDVDTGSCRAALAGASVVHVHLDDWSRRLLPLARDAGAIVSCDLQDISDLDDAYRADFIEAADIVFMSAANVIQPAQAAARLAAMRTGRVVVVGAGAMGCLVAHDGRVESFPALDLPGLPVIDTNGAGDNLAIGFLVAHLFDGLPVPESVTKAQSGARWICSQRGDEKSPITRDGLARLDRTGRDG